MKRRDLIKGLLTVPASTALIAVLPAKITAGELEAVKINLDARSCPDCHSPMAECLEPRVWTCLICNNDKWYRFRKATES